MGEDRYRKIAWQRVLWGLRQHQSVEVIILIKKYKDIEDKSLEAIIRQKWVKKILALQRSGIPILNTQSWLMRATIMHN